MVCRIWMDKGCMNRALILSILLFYMQRRPSELDTKNLPHETLADHLEFTTFTTNYTVSKRAALAVMIVWLVLPCSVTTDGIYSSIRMCPQCAKTPLSCRSVQTTVENVPKVGWVDQLLQVRSTAPKMSELSKCCFRISGRMPTWLRDLTDWPTGPFYYVIQPPSLHGLPSFRILSVPQVRPFLLLCYLASYRNVKKIENCVYLIG